MLRTTRGRNPCAQRLAAIQREYELEDDLLISRIDLRDRLIHASPTFIEVRKFGHGELKEAAGSGKDLDCPAES